MVKRRLEQQRRQENVQQLGRRDREVDDQLRDFIERVGERGLQEEGRDAPIRTPTAARRTVGDRLKRAARGCSRPITTSRPATVNSVWDKPTMRRRGPSTSAVQEITIACAFLPAIRRILPPAMHVPPGPRAPSPRLRADSILGLPDRSEPVADLLRLPRGQVRVPIRPEGEACRPAATRWSSHIGHAQPRRV